MSDRDLTERELACCRKLADYFDRGKWKWRGLAEGHEPWDLIALDESNYDSVLSALENYGFIGDVLHGLTQRFYYFEIRPSVAAMVRQLDKRDTADEGE
ncbi:MAG TPA: hypothetical protein VH120_10390 [Gemmataceae bacterium]|jgi:hypothetical protein|nr:hypothetical protein [Gemmataceae bacterium]